MRAICAKTSDHKRAALTEATGVSSYLGGVMRKRWFAPLLLLCGLPVLGQDMYFDAGTLHVAGGTEVVISGAITWHLGSGAVVVNDGHIDLGLQAALEETVGAPITGSGIESAQLPDNSPVVAAEPGGLGLTLSTPDAAGGLTVERGHLRQSATNGVLGIARWYGVSSVAPTTEALDMVFQYDPTELYGIDPAVLSLFGATQLGSGWLPLATTGIIGDATLSATDNAPWAFFTAFDLDAATSVSETLTSAAFRVWPTAFDASLSIQGTNSTIQRVQLLDARGRCVWEERPLQVALFTCALPVDLASGPYLLRVNDHDTFRLMHP